MDSRIIEFLRSGCCEGLLTVAVKEHPVYRDEKGASGVVKGLKGYTAADAAVVSHGDEKDGFAVESSSGGVTVGEVWGALSLDERMSFLDGCNRVLGRNYLEVENLDF